MTTLLQCAGGELALPGSSLVLVDRADGGHLIVNPPRAVWERSELTSSELMKWSCLVAAAGRAMLETLPQLAGGCINYWEAGNWSLHDDAEPHGPKNVREHRRVHLHLLGRSRSAKSDSWRWGEAPVFPEFRRRHEWAAKHERLSDAECRAIVHAVRLILSRDYGF